MTIGEDRLTSLRKIEKGLLDYMPQCFEGLDLRGNLPLKCICCGFEKAIDWHHVKDLALVPLCPNCHALVHRGAYGGSLATQPTRRPVA